MFLALHDKGKDMERVAEALLMIAARYRPNSERTRQATQAFYEDLADELNARPVYTVFTLVAAAIDERVKPLAPAGGGNSVICQAIRREFPLATENFRKVGKQTGGPDQQGESSCSVPVRLFSILRGDA
jgi:predicted kinase